MTAPFYTQVALDGFDFPDFDFTVLLAAGITELGTYSDALGLTNGAQVGFPVCWDGTNPNQVRIAQPGDEIVGVIKTIENRVIEGHNVGTVSFKFAKLLPIDPAATGGAIPIVGSKIIGGSVAGSVKAAAGTEAFFASLPRVVEVRNVAGVNYVVAFKA